MSPWIYLCMVVGFIGVGAFTFLMIYIFGIKASEDCGTDVCHQCGERMLKERLSIVHCGMTRGRFCDACVRELNARRANRKYEPDAAS